jgi:hypothetical protein
LSIESWPTSQILTALNKGPGGPARARHARDRMAHFLSVMPDILPERQWTRLELHHAHVLH